MKAFSRFSAIVAPILLLGALAGCGQAGPLYLPQRPPKPVPPDAAPPSAPSTLPATPASAPASEQPR